MARVISKKNFIEKLKFHLSFYFNDDECTSILNDYEEWFENETLQGKNENEICSALQEPKKIVRNMISESDSGGNRMFLLFRNTMFKTLCLMLVHFMVSLFMLNYCNKNGLEYFYFAIGINFLYFLMGMFFIKKSVQFSHHRFNVNLLMIGLIFIIVLSEFFFLPKFVNPHSGFVCEMVTAALIFILVCANIYFVVKNFIQSQQSEFYTIFHISGIISILFFLTNQLHMFYDNIPEGQKYLVISSLFIYFEVVLLGWILYKSKMRAKEEQP